jgi:hypothetical protein
MVIIAAQSNASTIWKPIAIGGVSLVIVGISAGYIDEATHGRLNFLSDHFDIVLSALLIGVISTCVGLIGWSRKLKRGGRARMAGIVFAFPWIAGALGYPIDGFNIHGPSALVMLLIVPASILTLLLRVMADN